MILTDSHCHLYLDQFEEDREEVLKRCVDNRVLHIFLPAIDWKSIQRMEDLTHPEISFHKMAGIHPCSVEENLPIDFERLTELCLSDEYVAVGETGLDYYWSTEFVEEQKKSLREHCRIAKQSGKPVVLHNRESTSDLLDLIESEQNGSLKGVWHCFTGTVEEGKKALDLGLYLGVGGVSTFKNSNVDNILKHMPLEKLILETDAPYLAPSPYRGKRNEPAYIRVIAKNLSELFQKSLQEIADITTKNASRLFNVILD